MYQSGLNAALSQPRRILYGLLALVIGIGALMVRVQIDTDPENMLSADEPARRFHNDVKQRFNLHDMVVLGVEYPQHREGVFNPQSLSRIYQLSKQIEAIDHVIETEILDFVHVDDIREAGPGAVRFQWLLDEPPKNETEAVAIREAAQRLPMFNGTLVSEDGKYLAMYIPVDDKQYSYQVSEHIKKLINDLNGPETYHFAGLPVAEDTFGFEMFKQMAISAPLAALVIFFLMWLFFRSFFLIIVPMIVAIATVIMTMGLLIGSGFTVHIMSSMIPIFLMPIAVVDSIHILSEFADLYPDRADARTTIREVIGHLFVPMLYTSLTSAAGFLSLVITPIPPVQVFGSFVGIGIGIAFVLTIFVIPAYVVLLSPEQLSALIYRREKGNVSSGIISKIISGIRLIGLGATKFVVVLSVALLAVGFYGVSLIKINDNPVRWFQEHHPIRKADSLLNQVLAGTYPAYLVLDAIGPSSDPIEAAREAIEPSLKNNFDELVATYGEDLAAELDNKIFDDVKNSEAWKAALHAYERAESSARVFQDPKMLLWLSQLQKEAEDLSVVGKSTSISDVIKTVHRELRGGADNNFRIPLSQAGIAQTLLTFQSSHRPTDLFHVVTPNYRSTAIWLQLRSGDNQDMSFVRDHLDRWVSEHPPPVELKAEWAGLTYINLIWQEKMVQGMLESLGSAFVVVFIMMVILFRSLFYGVLSMVPLVFTIILIYGIIGIIGKDYDMPVAVLSSLSLGLSIDFAIHFLERSRQLCKEMGTWERALPEVFEAPARAIVRNAIVIAIGFLPLFFAPLIPYNTVGVLMAAIMAASSLATLIILPAVLQLSLK